MEAIGAVILCMFVVWLVNVVLDTRKELRALRRALEARGAVSNDGSPTPR